MPDQGEPQEPFLPDVDAFLSEVFGGIEEGEMTARLSRVAHEKGYIELAQLGEQFGIPVHPGFIDRLQSENHNSPSDDETLNNYYDRLIEIYTTQYFLSLGPVDPEVIDAEEEQRHIDAFTTEIIDPEDPDWPKWKKFAEHVTGLELLPGVEPEAIPAVVKAISHRLDQAEVLDRIDWDIFESNVEDIKAVLAAHIGMRDDMDLAARCVYSLELHTRDMPDFDSIDLMDFDSERGSLRELKDMAANLIAKAYELDNTTANEKLREIISELRSLE